jgi:AAA family ATP:ADP antiporter
MGAFLNRIFPLRPEDWPKALPLSAFFFFVISTFWILKPMKRGMMVNYFAESPLCFLGHTFDGAQTEQFGKALNLLVAYLAVILFTWLVKRFPRHYLVLIFGILFSGLFLLYSFLIQNPNAPVVVSFYVLGDIFNTVMVVLFWSFTDDICAPPEAKRSYGLIGLGGVLGGFFGATIVAQNVESAGRSVLLISCVVPMILVILLAFIVQRGVVKKTGNRHPAATPTTIPELWEGAKLTLASRYLLAIAGLILVYGIVSNLIDFQFARAVQANIAVELRKDTFFAMVGQFTGIASILIQVFLTSRVLQRLGVRAALSFLPVAILVTSFGFLLFPVLGIIAVTSVSDNSMHYSINQSAKEVLYTATSRDAIYKAKAFIDMFLERFAKVISIFFAIGLVLVMGNDIRWLSLLILALGLVWYALIVYLGKEFNRRASLPTES